MRKNLNDLLTKEMTRKQFLQLMAGGMLALFGFSNFLAFLSSQGRVPEHLIDESPQDPGRHGFGSSKFGV